MRGAPLTPEAKRLPQNLLFAGDQNPSNFAVNIYALKHPASPLRTITDDLFTPDWLTLDGARNLYVGMDEGGSGGLVRMYAFPYTQHAVRTYAQYMFYSFAIKVAVANDGTVDVGSFVSNVSSPYSEIVTFPPNSTAASRLIVLPHAQSGLWNIYGLAVDDAGNLYVAYGQPPTSGLSGVIMFPKGSSAYKTLFTFPADVSQVSGLAFDGAGDLVTSYDGAYYAYPPGATHPSFSVPIPPGSGAAAQFAFDASGTTLYTPSSNGVVAVAWPSGTVTQTGAVGGAVAVWPQLPFPSIW